MKMRTKLFWKHYNENCVYTLSRAILAGFFMLTLSYLGIDQGGGVNSFRLLAILVIFICIVIALLHIRPSYKDADKEIAYRASKIKDKWADNKEESLFAALLKTLKESDFK